MNDNQALRRKGNDVSKVLVDLEEIEAVRNTLVNGGGAVGVRRSAESILAQPAEAKVVEVVAWAPSSVLQQLKARHNNAPCILTDGPTEFNDAPLVPISALSAVTAERDRLLEEVARLEQYNKSLNEENTRLFADYLAADDEANVLSKDAELYRRLRDLPDDQAGKPGVPCVAVPRGPFSGTYVSGEELDAAMAAKEGI